MAKLIKIVAVKVKSEGIFSNYYLKDSCITDVHKEILKSELFHQANEIEDGKEHIVIYLDNPSRELVINKKYLEAYCFEYKEIE